MIRVEGNDRVCFNKVFEIIENMKKIYPDQIGFNHLEEKPKVEGFQVRLPVVHMNNLLTSIKNPALLAYHNSRSFTLRRRKSTKDESEVLKIIHLTNNKLKNSHRKDVQDQMDKQVQALRNQLNFETKRSFLEQKNTVEEKETNFFQKRVTKLNPKFFQNLSNFEKGKITDLTFTATKNENSNLMNAFVCDDNLKLTHVRKTQKKCEMASFLNKRRISDLYK